MIIVLYLLTLQWPFEELFFLRYSFSYVFNIFYNGAYTPYLYTNRRNFRQFWFLLGDDSLYDRDSDSDSKLNKLNICDDELQSIDEVSV